MAGEAIFISYRRDDSKQDADDLYRAIAARIGESHLFKDVDNIPIGADFGAHIRGILPPCQIALIVIGPKWSKAKDQRGRRRLQDPYDWWERQRSPRSESLTKSSAATDLLIARS